MTSSKRLYRRSSAGRLGGVCAGIAEYLDADVTFIRLLWIVLSIVPGGFIGGLIAYVAAWVIMPNALDPAAVDTGARRLMRSRADRQIGGVCGGLAEYLDLDPTVVRVVCAILAIIPGSIVFGVLAYFIAWFVMPVRPAAVATPAPVTV